VLVGGLGGVEVGGLGRFWDVRFLGVGWDRETV